MQFRDRKSQATEAWAALKRAARKRSNDACEFCGLPLDAISDLHHRYYPKHGPDTLDILMIVHRECHKAIHFGAKVRALKGSLAAKGDSGKGVTAGWRNYLRNNQ